MTDNLLSESLDEAILFYKSASSCHPNHYSKISSIGLRNRIINKAFSIYAMKYPSSLYSDVKPDIIECEDRMYHYGSPICTKTGKSIGIKRNDFDAIKASKIIKLKNTYRNKIQ